MSIYKKVRHCKICHSIYCKKRDAEVKERMLKAREREQIYAFFMEQAGFAPYCRSVETR